MHSLPRWDHSSVLAQRPRIKAWSNYPFPWLERVASLGSILRHTRIQACKLGWVCRREWIRDAILTTNQKICLRKGKVLCGTLAMHLSKRQHSKIIRWVRLVADWIRTIILWQLPGLSPWETAQLSLRRRWPCRLGIMIRHPETPNYFAYLLPLVLPVQKPLVRSRLLWVCHIR